MGKAKDREVYAATRADPEVDEDVRQMQSETDTLRRKSQAAEQAAGSLNGDVQFPPRTPRAPGSSSRRDVDTVAPLAQQETPQIEKNKIMRGETGHRRRSSVSRGKRASSSYETTGIICELHVHLFYFLIRQPRDQSESSPCSASPYIRVRLKLLQAHRLRTAGAATRSTTAHLVFQPRHERTCRSSPASVVLKTSVHELRQGPTTALDSPGGGSEASGGELDADVGGEEGGHERVRRGRVAEWGRAASFAGKRAEHQESGPGGAVQWSHSAVRTPRFSGHPYGTLNPVIFRRSKQEAEAWKELSDSYDSHRKSVHAEMEKRRRALAGAKSKGKERASAEDLDDWDVERRDLPEQFLGSGSVDIARGLVFGDASKKTPLLGRLQELEYTVRHCPAILIRYTSHFQAQMDRLHTFANSALQTTRVAEADLDRRFALLNISLASRSQPPTQPDPTALSSYIPPSRPRPPATDPQDLLRALSRIDADRPQTQVGDAARRAVREVQRAADATAGMAERRLTGVPPPTPRKPPGTPRRATTPGKGR